MWKLDLLCCCNPHVTCVMFCLAARSHHLFMGFDATIFSTLNPFSLSSKKVHHAGNFEGAEGERADGNWTKLDITHGIQNALFYRLVFSI